MRYYEDSLNFFNKFKNIEKTLFMINESNREFWLLEFIFKELLKLDIKIYLDIYKKNKIDNDINKILPVFIEIGEITKDIVNSLDYTFMITKKYSEIIFHKCKILISKYRGFD